jgi:hypothetical protein
MPHVFVGDEAFPSSQHVYDPTAGSFWHTQKEYLTIDSLELEDMSNVLSEF